MSKVSTIAQKTDSGSREPFKTAGGSVVNIPVFGICGYSGSGKTTAIEEVIRHLTRRNLKVGVIKHDVHGLNVDHEGKDSDRFFKAGADVVMRGPTEGFLRAHRTPDYDLPEMLRVLCPFYDVILVEGFKSTPLFERVWLLKDDSESCPSDAANVRRVLRRDEDRVGAIMEILDSWLPKVWLATPVFAGILTGGASGAKRQGGKSSELLEASVAAVRPFVGEVFLLGDSRESAALRGAPVVLPEARCFDWPLGGMVAAMRWHPLASWLFLAGGKPPSAGSIERLLAARAPGVWAAARRSAGKNKIEMLPGYYDFRSRSLLEGMGGVSSFAASPKVKILSRL